MSHKCSSSSHIRKEIINFNISIYIWHLKKLKLCEILNNHSYNIIKINNPFRINSENHVSLWYFYFTLFKIGFWETFLKFGFLLYIFTKHYFTINQVILPSNLLVTYTESKLFKINCLIFIAPISKCLKIIIALKLYISSKRIRGNDYKCPVNIFKFLDFQRNYSKHRNLFVKDL